MTRRVIDLNPGPTRPFGIYGTDLLFPVLTPDGKRILWFGGDSFEDRELRGWWSSPIMLWSWASDPYNFQGAFGRHNHDRQLLPYVHNQGGVSTKLPTSAIFVLGKLFLHYMIMGPGGLDDTVGTGMASSKDEGGTWTDHGQLWRADDRGGVNQMRAMVDGRDGWIYHFTARGLARNSNVILLRCRPADILTPSKYEAWGLNGPNRSWAWGRDGWPILPNDVTVGELWAGWVDGKLVLSYLRLGVRSGIEVKVGNQGVMTNWTTCPTYLPLANGYDGPAAMRNIYGGYLAPGSTLRNLRIVASQWVGSDPYHAVVWDEIDVSQPSTNPLAKALADFLAWLRR